MARSDERGWPHLPGHRARPEEGERPARLARGASPRADCRARRPAGCGRVGRPPMQASPQLISGRPVTASSACSRSRRNAPSATGLLLRYQAPRVRSRLQPLRRIEDAGSSIRTVELCAEVLPGNRLHASCAKFRHSSLDLGCPCLFDLVAWHVVFKARDRRDARDGAEDRRASDCLLGDERDTRVSCSGFMTGTPAVAAAPTSRRR